MAGYSGAPLARKIGVKPDHRVVFLHRPDGWQIPELPDGVHPTDGGAGGGLDGADVVIAFYRERARLDRDAPRFAAELAPTGMIWIAWPRRASGHDSDITENGLRDLLLPIGLVDVKVAALDENWSGLKFVWRKERRRPG